MRSRLLLLMVLLIPLQAAQAQTYEELKQALPRRQTQGAQTQRAQVEAAWKTGKLLDNYLLERSTQATQTVNQLAADLSDDPSRIYYALQFARAYPEAVPKLDLPWGFYQYLLAVNDPREREALVQRAFVEDWNWDTLRAEVKNAGRENKEFVFTNTPGKTGVYRVMKAKRGPYLGELVLDLGFGNYWKPAKLKAKEYEIVEASCKSAAACTFKSMPEGEKNLFTYPADVIHVMDGDTFQALIDLGFGVTTLQTFRLWGLDSPEMNTRAGRETKKFLEGLLVDKRVVLRAMRMEKYGRYLADVWSFSGKNNSPIYINQALTDRKLAEAQKRQTH